MLSTLGLKIFQPFVSADNNLKNSGNIIFYINPSERSSLSNVYAKGIYTEDGLVLLKGSKLVSEVTQELNKNYKKVLLERRTIEENGDIKIIDNCTWELQKDYKFSSPSLASAIVLGRSSNGWTEWKDENGKSLNDYYRTKC